MLDGRSPGARQEGGMRVCSPVPLARSGTNKNLIPRSFLVMLSLIGGIRSAFPEIASYRLVVFARYIDVGSSKLLYRLDDEQEDAQQMI